MSVKFFGVSRLQLLGNILLLKFSNTLEKLKGVVTIATFRESKQDYGYIHGCCLPPLVPLLKLCVREL